FLLVVPSRIGIPETGRRWFAAVEKSPGNLKIPAALDVLQLPQYLLNISQVATRQGRNLEPTATES
ncbi:MAG: hypothetical protein ACLPN5_13850, partial [Roseiarcus sp.]